MLMTDSSGKYPKDSPKKIIVRMPNWLGDVVMATPILADLRFHFKDAEITAMCQSNVAPLLKENPHINDRFSYQRTSGWVRGISQGDVIERLDNGKYDLGILLTNSFSSAYWFWRGKVKERIGFKGNFRSWFLTHALSFPKEKESQHLVRTYKALLAPLGIKESLTPPALYLNKMEVAEAKELLAKEHIFPGEHKIVGINPGAAFGSAKCWLPERFIQVSKDLLRDPKVRLIYFGDAIGSKLVEGICKELPAKNTLNLSGRTNLRQLLALIQLSTVFLTNDSGPMHIAAALGVPLVALFGSTSDVKTGPYGSGVVIHKHVECSPCYKRTCPIDFRCMKRIESDEVYQEILKFL